MVQRSLHRPSQIRRCPHPSSLFLLPLFQVRLCFVRDTLHAVQPLRLAANIPCVHAFCYLYVLTSFPTRQCSHAAVSQTFWKSSSMFASSCCDGRMDSCTCLRQAIIHCVPKLSTHLEIDQLHCALHSRIDIRNCGWRCTISLRGCVVLWTNLSLRLCGPQAVSFSYLLPVVAPCNGPLLSWRFPGLPLQFNYSVSFHSPSYMKAFFIHASYALKSNFGHQISGEV